MLACICISEFYMAIIYIGNGFDLDHKNKSSYTV